MPNIIFSVKKKKTNKQIRLCNQNGKKRNQRFVCKSDSSRQTHFSFSLGVLIFKKIYWRQREKKKSGQKKKNPIHHCGGGDNITKSGCPKKKFNVIRMRFFFFFGTLTLFFFLLIQNICWDKIENKKPDSFLSRRYYIPAWLIPFQRQKIPDRIFFICV